MKKEWQELLERIQKIQASIKLKGSVAWFRGHRCGEWQLHSTLHRHVLKLVSETVNKGKDREMKSLLREEYKSLYRHFKTDAWPLLKARERSDWGIIFAMQHYGIPTRLLDWTESFGCALYFAQWNRDRDHEAAIYVLDPQRLNLLTVNREGLIQLDEGGKDAAVAADWKWHPKFKPPKKNLTTIAIAPIFTNPRMLAQRSGFTVSGDSFEPFEKQFYGKDVVERIPLPAGTFQDAEEFLELAGLNAFNFFPDREGLRMKHEARVRKTIAAAKYFFLQHNQQVRKRRGRTLQRPRKRRRFAGR